MADVNTLHSVRVSNSNNPLSSEEQRKMDAYWRAANYLSVGQIYLMDNPLLKTKLRLEHVKPRLLGHWGTTPGLNFIYVHLNRLIKAHDLSVIYITGPGHGGPGIVANTYLEGTYSEVYPDITQDEAGLRKLFVQFSFPGGIPSHASPECPGSIHEGGELGYSLSHAFGAVFDNPDLVVLDEITGAVERTKTLTTPRSPEDGFLQAVADRQIKLDDVAHFLHGTTLVTNLIIERTGAKVGLVTTKGFRDVLEIQRSYRDELYNLQWDKPKALVHFSGE